MGIQGTTKLVAIVDDDGSMRIALQGLLKRPNCLHNRLLAEEF